MAIITEETHRLPAALWESIQDVCYRLDVKFVEDVSRILGIPALELKRRVLGVRGIPTVITVESGAWWTTEQCPVMEKYGSVWRRCCSRIEPAGYCWAHKHFKQGPTRKCFDDEIFKTMAVRKAVRFNGAVYWVSEKGDAVDMRGLPTSLHFDLARGTVRDDDTKIEST